MSMSKHEIAEKLQTLTQTELEILFRICQGMTYKDIATEFDLSVPMVWGLMTRIYKKLEIVASSGPTEREKLLMEVYCPQVLEIMGKLKE
jgi:DNA-binding CsgD family transcriptional regulator